MGRFTLAEKSGETKKHMENGESEAQDSSRPAPPFPPERLRKLLLNLKSCLGWAEGQPLSIEDWSPMASRLANTLASWCESCEAHQLQALFASLECLPETMRHHLIDETCRTHPTASPNRAKRKGRGYGSQEGAARNRTTHCRKDARER